MLSGWLLGLADRARDALRRRRRPDLAAGRRGEDLAHRHLRARGWQVVARNWRTPSGDGEVDLVAWEGRTLVIVEVKSRASEEHGAPDRALDAAKRDRLVRAARCYARRAGVDPSCLRFDLVNVVFSRPPRIDHFRDAFGPGVGGRPL
jgi:putative endonuclease